MWEMCGLRPREGGGRSCYEDFLGLCPGFGLRPGFGATPQNLSSNSNAHQPRGVAPVLGQRPKIFIAIATHINRGA